ncbi:LCP family protein [Oryzihumus leptocrescens]|uniref:LytR family transcriptional attenuator n=1 Tax=Oryzihumus leptocrescens TaxID=297536 RepID=A0A542ZN53_9MICO|nr:LCP family protein [Oryzihumus leptocrescens]TQL61765.1 LytR family transcriptional attenuator [Oryzihumus leptocrescens]
MRPTQSAHLTRRRLRAAGAGVVALALALAGCTGSDKPAPKAAPSTTSRPAPPPSPFQAKGLPAGLLAAVKPIYVGGAVPASPSAAAALKARKVTPGAKVTVVGSLGTWKKTPIAVVTSGKDVTLAVGPKWKVVGGWWPSLKVSRPSLGPGPRRVLFIGSDARPGENPATARGDSLHILGLDGKGRGGIVGIPRDSWVPLSTGGHGKINSALPRGGPVAETRTVSAYTGVPLEGYVVTGFQGFVTLVDHAGGVRLTSPRAFHDTYSQALIRKGLNILNGGQALAYARSRHAQPAGDFDRSLNQGRLLLAGAAGVRLAGPSRLPRLLQNSSPHVITNLSPERVLTLAATVFATWPGGVHNRVATGGVGMSPDGQSIVELGSAARALFADIRDGSLR